VALASQPSQITAAAAIELLLTTYDELADHLLATDTNIRKLAWSALKALVANTLAAL